MEMEARGVRYHAIALENGHGAIGLLCGRQHAEDAFAAGDREDLALQLGDHIARFGGGRFVETWESHDEVVKC